MWDRIKIAGGIISAVIIAGFLFMPSSQKPADGKIHLQYWYVSGDQEQIPFHAREFNSSQDSIVVDCTPLPWNEHEKKILTAILSGNPPDVVNLVSPVAKWASRFALVPLDSLMKESSFDSTIFFPALWNEMKWRNRIYAIPLYSNSYAFFYNKKLFKEAGLDPNKPPTTWEQVLEYSKKLTKRDDKGRIYQIGFIPNYGNLSTAMLMAWELGAKFLIDGGTKVDMTNPAMIRALTWVTNYYNEYNINDVSSFMAGFGYADQQGFISQKVAMMVLDNTFPDQIKLYNPNLQYGVSLIPSFKGYPTASSSGSWWLAIPRGAKHIKAAWEFMQFAVRKEVQLKEAESEKVILYPANKYAAGDSSFVRDDYAKIIFNEEMDYSHSPTIVPLAHDVFWREFIGARDRAIHKIQTPIAALQQAQSAIQQQLNQAIDYDNYVQSRMSIKEPK